MSAPVRNGGEANTKPLREKKQQWRNKKVAKPEDLTTKNGQETNTTL